MLTDKRLTYICTRDGVDFYEFKASLFRYFYTPMAYYEKLFSRSVRETLDYIRGGYRVIYMAVNDEPVGYGTVTRGGGRYKFDTKDDIVCCNIWVQPEHRGHGYSTILYKAMTESIGGRYGNAHAFIRHDNLPSVKAAERAGFRLTGNAAHKGLLQSVVRAENGRLGIYEKAHQKDS